LLPEWLGDALSAAASERPDALAGALVTYLSSILVYSLRLEVVSFLAGAVSRPSFFRSVEAHLTSILVNNITPAFRAGGELVRAAVCARRCRGSLASVFGVVVFERITEALGVLGLIVLALWLGVAHGYVTLVLVGGLLAAVVLVVERYWDRLINLVERYVPERYRNEIVSETSRWVMRRLLRSPELVIFGVAVGFAVWILDVLRIYFILEGLGVHSSFIKALALSIIYIGIGFVALTPGGLGIVEGGLFAALVAMGVPGEVAAAATLIERLISYGLGTLLGLLAAGVAGGRRLWRALR